MKKRILKLLIDFCGCVVPYEPWLVRLARRVGLRGKPRAQNHLDHFLYGRGETLHVPTDRLLADDANVRHVLFHKVATALTGGKRCGTVTIPQSIYLDHDWGCALGGIQINWRREREQIRAWFNERYCWKPKEPRATQRVHQAAENLKAAGAREFMMEGAPTQIPLSRIFKKQPFVKLDRLLL